MNGQVRLTAVDIDILQRAYLAYPKGDFNIASISIFDDDLKAHAACDSDNFERLARLGYINGLRGSVWQIQNESVDVLIFRLTPLGLSEAEKSIAIRRQYSLRDRLVAVERSDWIALIALIVSVIALFGART